MGTGLKQHARRRVGETVNHINKATRYTSELIRLFGRDHPYQIATFQCVATILIELSEILLDLAAETWGEAYDTVESLRK